MATSNGNYRPILAVTTVLVISVAILAIFLICVFALKYPERFRAADYGDVSNVFQAFTSWISITLLAIASLQIVEMRRNNKQSQHKADADAYRLLIAGDLPSIRQFVKTSNELGQRLTELALFLNGKADPPTLKAELVRFRGDVKCIGEKTELSRMTRKPVLEDIESLLNEYNSLSMLILNDSISKDFATDQAMDNFYDMHDRLEAFITLRRRISGSYASHYLEYIRKNPRKRTSP